jgi:hypothetical protein
MANISLGCLGLIQLDPQSIQLIQPFVQHLFQRKNRSIAI